MLWHLSFALCASACICHGALKVMVIGDSLSNEYAIQTPFSAPDSAPLTANTMNWVEILTARRGNEIGFGDYSGLGHEYNWGISGFDTVMWMDIIHAGILDPQFALRLELWDHYEQVNLAVIMLGGNDVRSRYGDLYNATPGDTTATDFIATVRDNLEDIIDEIRSINASLPIVLANVPDLGTTPDKIADHPDPTKRANASAIINDLNTALVALADSKSVTLAPISELTDDLLKPETYYIGAIEMVKGSDPENPPNYLFCKAGLHPSTGGQARITNIILEAINTEMNTNIALLPDREIITHLLELNPDQPFIDWLANKGITDATFTLDSDRDGIPNLGEYLLDLDPLTPNNNHTAFLSNTNSSPALSMRYKPDPAAARLADTVIKQSSDLSSWADIPSSMIYPLPDGSTEARVPVGMAPLFLRMEFRIKP